MSFILFLATILTAKLCNDNNSIDSLKIACPSNNLLKKFTIPLNKDAVSILSCEPAVIDKNTVTLKGYPTEIDDACDYNALTTLEPISCASVGGILQSIKYK